MTVSSDYLTRRTRGQKPRIYYLLGQWVTNWALDNDSETRVLNFEAARFVVNMNFKSLARRVHVDQVL